VIAIEARDLAKRYGNVSALAGVSLEIAPGEVFCLLGPNGAGKTTLINVLLGFVAPTSGQARIYGCDVTSDAEQVRRRTAYIPEQVTLYPTLSGIENLRFFCDLAGHREYSTTELRAFLHDAGLDRAAADRRLSSYSKGMRQKVGVAIALAKRADVLLLDEPTSGLDPHASNEFAGLLATLAARGCAVLMTTHDLFRAKMSGTRVGILHQGRLVATFAARDIEGDELEHAYLRHVRDA
jgi:ABC-2 type transport system ATP-binding protein